ncbi:Na+/H+ antiporter subunit E [Allochromatium humboldtianum]|uniref:Na+/H+ antiporter subunit E n=1 Tax=Allochromatium humboldtianum TaxID=504901 RepID=A0A850R502_9GAMM|nr:Na+/H+ antiporter subunit E [Allochromatium humboldtianum]NVZ08438.1 Na+/H+ antiporter subunit E [Allochromatium humboldtianum]
MTRSKSTFGAILLRLLLFACAWLVIAGTDPGSWIIGAPAVIAATWASLRLSRRDGGSPRLLAALVFVPFFLWQSLKGGLDVTWRVMRPRMRIAPGIHTYRLRLTNASARVVLLDTLSLLPGTLSADLRGDVLTVHALDAADGAQLDADIAQLEQRIGTLFGERLAAPTSEADPERADVLSCRDAKVAQT